MVTGNSKPIEIFYSYASTGDGKDEKLQQELEKHLGVLKRQGRIANWHKRNILAGQVASEEVRNHLNSAQIILLLISPDFIASDECWDVEMDRALERQREEKTLVIPVLLRPLDYKEAPFNHLRVLPRNGKPVTSWSNQDEAFEDIANNIRLLAAKFEKTQKVSWKELGVGISLAAAISAFVTSSTANTPQVQSLGSETTRTTSPSSIHDFYLYVSVMSTESTAFVIPTDPARKNIHAVRIDEKAFPSLHVTLKVVNMRRFHIVLDQVALIIKQVSPTPNPLNVWINRQLVTHYHQPYKVVYIGQSAGAILHTTFVPSPIRYVVLAPAESDLLSLQISSRLLVTLQFQVQFTYHDINESQPHTLVLPYNFRVVFSDASNWHMYRL